jgi:uncharacterized protein YjbI with pentapeptide repeats
MVNSVKKQKVHSFIAVSTAFFIAGCSAKSISIGVGANATRKAYEQSQLTTSTLEQSGQRSKLTRITAGSIPNCDKINELKTNCSNRVIAFANFNLVNLMNYDFSGTDLHGSSFIGASLQNVDFSNANLEDCDLSRADLTGANLNGAKLTGATMPDGTVHE